MRKIITAITLVLATLQPTFASDYCTSLGEMAESTMRMRQAGVPLVRAINKHDEIVDGNSAIGKVVRHILILAYEQPVYAAQQNKEIAINEFGSSVFVQCLKAAR